MSCLCRREASPFLALLTLVAVAGDGGAQEVTTPGDLQPDIGPTRLHRELWTFDTGG